MFNSLFKIIYFIEFMIIAVIRRYFTRKKYKQDIVRKDMSGLDVFMLILNGIGMAIPLVYVFTSQLDFADYYLPNWVGWLGALIFLAAIWMLYVSHRDLGRHWTALVSIREHHKLVTEGIYGHIRHPMYTAHLLWAVAQVLMLHNWIAGYSFLLTMIPFYFFRVRREEKMLAEEFGEQYTVYKKSTGAMFPKLKD